MNGIKRSWETMNGTKKTKVDRGVCIETGEPVWFSSWLWPACTMSVADTILHHIYNFTSIYCIVAHMKQFLSSICLFIFVLKGFSWRVLVIFFLQLCLTVKMSLKTKLCVVQHVNFYLNLDQKKLWCVKSDQQRWEFLQQRLSRNNFLNVNEFWQGVGLQRSLFSPTHKDNPERNTFWKRKEGCR